MNLGFLALILAAVFIKRPIFAREALMLIAALGSWFMTNKSVHEANHLNFHPLREVAVLFVGIFATMMPAMDYLKFHAASIPHTVPVMYWGAGLLSSVLDNAPTYLGFLSAAAGANVDNPARLVASLADPAFARLVLAISVASVFFGATTYIGNGPNFMVKSIAAHQKVHAPTFLGYILRFTLPFMLPMLILIWLLFFRS